MKKRKNNKYHKFNNRNIRKQVVVENKEINEEVRESKSHRFSLFKTKLFYLALFILIGFIVFLAFYFGFSKLNKPNLYFDKDKKEIVKYSQFNSFNGNLIEVNETNYYNKNGYLYYLDKKSFDDFNLYFQYSKLTLDTNKEGNKKEDKDLEDKNKYNKYEFFLGYDLDNKNVEIKELKYSVLLKYEFEEEGELIEERNLDLVGSENRDYIFNSDYNKRSKALKISKDHRNKEPYIFIKLKYKKTFNKLETDQIKYIKIALSKEYKPIIKNANNIESKKDEN